LVTFERLATTEGTRGSRGGDIAARRLS